MYIETELPWARWIRYFAVALDLDELEHYESYVHAGGDPKKYKWTSPDHAGTRPMGTPRQELLKLGATLTGGNMPKGDVYQYAKATGKQMVFRATRHDSVTGDFIEYVYVDKDGNEVDPTGYQIVQSRHRDAVAEAVQLAERFN